MAISVFRNGLVAAVLTGFASLASAQVYMGGAVGFNSFNSNDVEKYEIEEESTAFELLMGIKLIDVLGLEFAYLNLGEFRDYYYDTDLNFSGFAMSANAFLPLGTQMDLYAKVGIFFWELDERYRGFDDLVDDGQDLFVGGGAVFHLTDEVDINLEYKSMEMDFLRSGVVTAGVRFVF
jgi:hypothetical protein